MSDIQRFMSHVDTSGGVAACHPWTGRRRSGYGRFFLGGREEVAHRWLLGYLRGVPLTPEELALHHCDNPPCCNPYHLYVGDHAQNMRDRNTRGRARSGHGNETHCPAGHAYDHLNTYIRRYSGELSSRTCRACNRAAVARYKARQIAVLS